MAPQGDVQCELGYLTCLGLKAVQMQLPSDIGTLTVMLTLANWLFKLSLVVVQNEVTLKAMALEAPKSSAMNDYGEHEEYRTAWR